MTESDGAARAETAGDADAASIHVVTRDVSQAEVAAVTAVVAAALRERDERAALERSAVATASAWDRHRRGLRQPLGRGWRSW